MIELDQYKGAFPWVDDIIKELETARADLLDARKENYADDYNDVCDRLRSERQRNEKLTEAAWSLDDYVKHTHSCRNGILGSDCTCGLVEAKKKFKQALAENAKESK